MQAIPSLGNIVGTYSTFDETFTFMQKSTGKITVTVLNNLKKKEKTAKLERISFACLPIQLTSEAEKVRWLLKNKHFEVICNKDEDHHRLVSFSLMQPVLFEWNIIHECVIPGSELTPLSDGSFISYGEMSDTMIWNWKANSSFSIPNPDSIGYISCVEISSDLHAFTTLRGNIEIRERVNGKLNKVIPDQLAEKYDSHSLRLLSTGVLCEIRHQPLGDEKVEKVVLWDWKKGKKIQEIPGYKGFIELSNKDLLFFSNSGLFFYRTVKSGKRYAKIKENPLYNTKVYGVFELENNKILIVTSPSSCKNCQIFNLITNDSIFIKGLDSLTTIFPFPKGFVGIEEEENVFLYKIDVNEKISLGSEIKELVFPVSSFCQLIDGTMAFGHQNGKFIIYDQNGNCLFTMNFNSWVAGIIELTDGSLLVKTLRKAFILHPKKKENLNALMIAMLEVHLKQTPENFSIYPKLAEAYKKLCETDKEYQLFLRGIGIAIRCNNYYKARRFFEHASAIYPEKEEPFLVFLSQLDDKSDLPLKRTILLKFHKLFEKQKALPLEGLLCTKDRCKTRLILEDANFTYTEELLYAHKETHLKLADSIIATKLSYPTHNVELEVLRKKGITIKFNVDPRKIHEIFKGKRIERIHLQCPDTEDLAKEKEQFKEMIMQFFESGSELQRKGDQIHVILLQDPLHWTESQMESGIVNASTHSSYRLIRKRLRKNCDYQQKKNRHGELITNEKREFIFEKTSQNGTEIDVNRNIQVKAQHLCDPRIKEYHVEAQNNENLYFECSTDEDSSDYFASESDDSPFHI